MRVTGLLPLLLTAAVSHAEPKLDRGGKSLDFGNFRIPRKEQAAEGDNLIKIGNFDQEDQLKIMPVPGLNLNCKIGKYWHSTALIWSPDEELRKKIYPEMRICVEKDSAGRKNVFAVNTRRYNFPETGNGAPCGKE